MHDRRNSGKIDRIQVILLPPLLFIAGLLIYNVIQWVSPSAFKIEGLETVEVVQVIDKLSPLRGNGLLAAQAESISGGGSSRLVIVRPAQNGAFIMVRGRVSHGYLLDKIGMDSMLHIVVDTPKISVESNGETVDAILLGPRTETSPLRVEGIPIGPDEDSGPALFANQTILPAAVGQVSAGKFSSDNGMVVNCGIGVGKGGSGSLFTMIELQITMDQLSTAWVEQPKTVRLASTAVGSEDWDIGFLIPVGKKPAQIRMFGEIVGTVE